MKETWEFITLLTIKEFIFFKDPNSFQTIEPVALIESGLQTVQTVMRSYLVLWVEISWGLWTDSFNLQ